MSPSDLLAGVGDPPGGGLVVALSGGADSAVAAWLAATVGEGPVRALHVHHGTESADESAAAAAAIAAILDLPFESVTVEVGAGPSWEARAREARWTALHAKAEPTDTIVTGHHRDDLAETTLANLLRGAGATGLAAMASPRSGVWRPLLGLSRSAVRAVAQELSLPFFDDPSNLDTAFARNRLRHELLPALEELAPHAAASLARSAALLARDEAELEAAAVKAAVRRDAWGAVTVALAEVQTAPPAVAARIVRRVLRAAHPPYAGTAADVETVLGVAAGAASAGEVSGRLTVEREGPLLVVHTGPVAPVPSADLAIPGSVSFGALVVAARRAPPVLVRRTCLLSRDAVGATLCLRPAAAGERIAIAAGTKLVRDVLAEAGIPKRIRPAWPVAEAHGRIVAVAGIRSTPSERGRLGEEGTFELVVTEKQVREMQR